jgi:hypothetical protein
MGSSSPAILASASFSSRSRGRRLASTSAAAPSRCASTTAHHTRSASMLIGCFRQPSRMWTAIPKGDGARYQCSTGLRPPSWPARMRITNAIRLQLDPGSTERGLYATRGWCLRPVGRRTEACACCREAAGVRAVELSEKIEVEDGAVAISTMHFAKGLGVPVSGGHGLRRRGDPTIGSYRVVADDADLEEVYNTERHLLYVACTGRGITFSSRASHRSPSLSMIS